MDVSTINISIICGTLLLFYLIGVIDDRKGGHKDEK